MKKTCLLLLGNVFTIFSFAQVGIGTKTPHPSAMLEVTATNKGILIPRMTLAQRNTIKSPANSLMIYQTDNTPGYYYFASGVWTRLATGTGSGSGQSYIFGSPLLLTGTNVTLPQAGTTSNGYLSSVDWNTFNNKLSAASAASTYAPIVSPTFTGTVSGITKSMVGLGNVDNTSDIAKPISSLMQAALDGKASLSSPGLTGTPTAPTPTLGNNSTQIATTAFVNTAISTINTPDADAVTRGKIQLAGDLSGTAALPTIASGAITTNKIANESITDSKVANGISKSKVGLNLVDNTSDIDKPISTATQIAIDGKVSSNSAITGSTKTKITYDSKGLVTAGADATTTDINEGSNKYFTEERVRNTPLSGYSVGSNTEVSNADNVIASIGKLQAQINAKQSSGQAWLLGGNAGIDPSINFIGTTDSKDLVFKVNNIEAGRISTSTSTSLGFQSYNSTASACCNVGIGYSTLSQVNTNGYNTAVGFRALENDNIGIESVALGWHSLLNNKRSANTGLGSRTLENNVNGGGNVASGFMSLNGNTDGEENVGNGVFSLYKNTTGNKNIAIGSETMIKNTTGNYNVAIGFRADVASENLSNAIAIGSNSMVGCDDCLVLGSISGENSASTSVRVGIGTISPNTSAALEVKSDSKGILIPRVLASSRTAIQNPSEGLMVYQTDESIGFWYYSQSQWRYLNQSSGVGSGDMQYWDGQKWVVIPIGTEGETLLICDGVPTWGGCLASVSTSQVTSITALSAVCGGNVTKTGGSTVLDRGIVWSINPTPTIDLTTKLSLGSGKGEFSGTISNLEINTRYYVRSYVINPKGVAYGEEISFTTAGDGDSNATITDIDGNVYRTIVIGNQVWMKENLKTTKFNNGENIPDWYMTNRGYVYLNNDVANKNKYGAIYNFYTTVDPRNVCPAGWRVPSESDWTTLFNTLGGIAIAGNKMKDNSSLLWSNISPDANNSSGFSALPGGTRDCSFNFVLVGAMAQFASTRIDPVGAKYVTTIYSGSAAAEFSWHYDCNGAYVRCIKN
jgi:uncharacterized protein (TIGR02145 family)